MGVHMSRMEAEKPMTAEDFLRETGLTEPLYPGQIKFIHRTSSRPGSNFTVVYDWKTNPDKIRVEVRPGLTGIMPDKKALSKHDLWLQSENSIEFDMSDAAKKTKH